MGGWVDGWMGGGRSGLEAEVRGGAASGLPAPEIHGELAGDGDNGFLARGSGGPCAFGQDEEALFDRSVVGLEADQSPGQFDERGAQPRVAVLGHGARHPLAAAGVFAGAEAGVAADLPPVF